MGLGAALAAGLTRLVERRLFAVQPMDWVSFGGTAAVMLIAAVLASVAPGLKALRMDPNVALRSDPAWTSDAKSNCSSGRPSSPTGQN